MAQYQHVIAGSGLIGGFLGGIIGQSAQVRFIGRPTWIGRLAEGITLTDYAGIKAEYKASAEECLEALPAKIERSIIWLTVKNTALAELLKGLQPVVAADCILVCCQNGLGAAALTQKYFPGTRVLQGIVGCNVMWDEGLKQLQKTTEGEFYLERPKNLAPEITEALSMVQHELLSLCWRKEIEAVAWAKLQLNLANSINAIVNQPVRAMLLDRGCRQVIAALMDELLAVTAARNIRLPRLSRVPARYLPAVLRLPDWLFKRLASAMLHIEPNACSSMWRDLQAGRVTEIDYLNGAVAEQGALSGVACPLNKSVTDLMKALETSALVAARSPLDGNTLKFQLHLE